MATSKIELFQTEITIERNALIDEIDKYLDTCQKTYSVDNFQYQQISGTMTFVIKLSQSRFQGKTNVGNYVRLTQDNKTWYYFVNSVSWQSMMACSLNCTLDTINTFRDLVFSDETTITREHKNRVLKVANDKYYRLIDKESEGIYPLKYQIRKDTIYENGDNLNWYLIYRTRDNLTPDDITNPIACYLCADKELLVEKGSTETSKTLTYSDFQEGYYYYMVDLDNGDAQFSTIIQGETSETVYTIGNTYSLLANPTTRRDRVLRGITIMREGTSLYAQYMYDGNVYWQSSDSTSYTTSNPPVRPNDGLVISGNGFRKITNITLKKARLFRYSSNLYTYPEKVITTPYTVNYFINYDSRYINSIDEIDRTDSRLMKILLLPYCPTTYTKSSEGEFIFDDKWYYDSGLLRLSNDNLNLEFLNNITKIALSELVINDYLNPNRAKNIQWESKLYHSDYYTNKITYDSFSIDIPLERLYYKQEVPSATPEVDVVYKQTNTINSNSLFALDYKDNREIGYKSDNDYDNIMIVSRNNEEPIFNNGYVDYIRTGYNYDKKLNSLALQQQLVSGIFGSIASGTQFLGSVGNYSPIYQGYLQSKDPGGGFFTEATYSEYKAELFKQSPSLQKISRRENISSILPRGISTLAGIASTIVNTAFTSQNQKVSMEAKLAQLSSQSSTVSGSNDIDLLKYYNGNKLDNFKYNIKSEDRQALYNIFNYVGYASTERKIPRLDSRYWFNYIQCSPVFKQEQLYPYNDYLSDIKSRYESGITIYHTHNGKYDFDREKENVEVDCILPNLIDYVEVDDTQIMWTYSKGYDYVDNGIDTYWVIDINDGDYVYNTKGIDNCQVYDYDKDITGTINKIVFKKYNATYDLYSKEYVWYREGVN